MKTREEVARWLEQHWNDNIPIKNGWHFGKMDIRLMMDFIYDGSPKNESEEVFQSMKRWAKIPE